ncbi:MAG: hypothetical protein IKD76_01620 [Clostridia bacterium]|nr:hypothetical protein [Clostridia bacterium]
MVKKILRKTINKMKLLKQWYLTVYKGKGDRKLNYFTRLLYAFRGFSAKEYYWFDFEKNNYKDYISEFERIKSRSINGDYKIILDDKLLFEETFYKYVRVPRNYAWIQNGVVYKLHEYDVNNDNLFEFLDNLKMSVLKWVLGSEGRGTYIINAIGNGQYLVNGEQMDKEGINKLIRGCEQSILCEYIKQSDFENEIYDGSTNTLRIICAKKKNEPKARIIKAVQRIGNHNSKPIDNISAGGLASNIDLETGELGVAIAKYGELENRLKPYDNHPDSGSPIKGKKIPNWDSVKKEITDLTNRFPYLGFVAWDVLLTNEGICIIEGNASSGCGLFQLQHGIRSEELGDIYRSYGIMK